MQETLANKLSKLSNSHCLPQSTIHFDFEATHLHKSLCVARHAAN